ncbi:transposase family protein [Streptomyces sp. NPDC001415]
MTLHQVVAAGQLCRVSPLTVLFMEANASLWESPVFAGIDEVAVEAAATVFGTVGIVARGRSAGASCPACGQFSARVRDAYQRHLRDLPLSGQRVVIHLRIRRFICGSPHCARRTFAERFSRLTAPYARFTSRANHTLERIGLALAGRPGARLAAQLGRARPGPRVARAGPLAPCDRPAPRLGGLNTVLRYARAPRRQDPLGENRPRPSRLDPYKPCLKRRFAEGCTSVTRLQRELLAENAPVTYQMVRAYRHPAQRSRAHTAPATNSAASDRLAHPPPHHLERGGPHRPEGRPDALPRTGHGRRAHPRLRRDAHRPPRRRAPTWIDTVETSQLPGLTGFANHLRRDLDAVRAGLSLERSSGVTEGAVNPIKKIKTQLYGRTGFELLRKMILLQ